MKRLGQGRFVWPSAKEGKVALTPGLLSLAGCCPLLR